MLVFSATWQPPHPVLVGTSAFASGFQPAPVGLDVQGPSLTFRVLKALSGAVWRSGRLQCFAT